MPQTIAQKRSKAVAGYRRSLTEWERVIATHPAPNSERGQLAIVRYKLKIQRLSQLIYCTEAK